MVTVHIGALILWSMTPMLSLGDNGHKGTTVFRNEWTHQNGINISIDPTLCYKHNKLINISRDAFGLRHWANGAAKLPWAHFQENSQSIFKSGKIRESRSFWRKSGTHQVISLWIRDTKSRIYDFFCLISLKIYLNYKWGFYDLIENFRSRLRRSHIIKIHKKSCAFGARILSNYNNSYSLICQYTWSFYAIINLGSWKRIRGKKGNTIWLETGHPDYGCLCLDIWLLLLDTLLLWAHWENLGRTFR